ncbi:MAG: hypothetical protein RLZZ416_476 [Candidatus Parcubacteria bacterium]|jgi:hypothetical protein
MEDAHAEQPELFSERMAKRVEPWLETNRSANLIIIVLMIVCAAFALGLGLLLTKPFAPAPAPDTSPTAQGEAA